MSLVEKTLNARDRPENLGVDWEDNIKIYLN